MKTILALMILMIGLVVFPPGQVQASSHPTGTCFVLQAVDYAPVALCQMAAINPVTYFVCQPINAAVMVVKEGGNQIEKSVNTSLDLLFRNEIGITNTTGFTMKPDYARRTCLICKVINSQNLQAKILQSYGPVKIRADTQV